MPNQACPEACPDQDHEHASGHACPKIMSTLGARTGTLVREGHAWGTLVQLMIQCASVPHT